MISFFAERVCTISQPNSFGAGCTLTQQAGVPILVALGMLLLANLLAVLPTSSAVARAQNMNSGATLDTRPYGGCADG